jgi:hypothetical protein
MPSFSRIVRAYRFPFGLALAPLRKVLKVAGWVIGPIP